MNESALNAIIESIEELEEECLAAGADSRGVRELYWRGYTDAVREIKVAFLRVMR